MGYQILAALDGRKGILNLYVQYNLKRVKRNIHIIDFHSSTYTEHRYLFQDLFSVPPMYIFAAILPALMVTGLYFFDHSVASKMAQQKEFNLKKPSAFHYDILVLGIMVRILSDLSITDFSRRWCLIP